ncbi:MAG TPA: flippase-like domain-containing protein [Micropepsaceae bacterium]|nr:flippase-like domain-containing protein [Micropepsaceae bacterium]
MKVWALISSAVGIAFTAWLLSKYGFDRIVALVIIAGWAIPAVAAYHVLQIVLSGSAWRMVTEEGAHRLNWRSYYQLRWIREAINNLLPVVQLGGVAVGTRLLTRRGVPLSPAIASAIVDTTMEFMSEITFTLTGVGLLFLGRFEHGAGSYALAGVLSAGVMATILLGAQWLGLAKIVEWALKRFGKTLGGTGSGGTQGLHQAIIAVYRTPRRIVGGFLLHFAGWIFGAFEIAIALAALGHWVGIMPCLLIEALGQALRSAGFAVPGAIGVQEGGYVLAVGLFGLPPETGIALSIIKRLRDVVLGLPALAVWHWLEGRPHAADAPTL